MRLQAEMRSASGRRSRSAGGASGFGALQRQLTLIHNAQITTIDSFCLYVIRNHFHEIDLEPDFRIGDEGELKLLKEDVLRGVLESNYEQMSPEFAAFAKGYVSGKSDAKVAEMILSLYEFSMSYPWPWSGLLPASVAMRSRMCKRWRRAPWDAAARAASAVGAGGIW